MNNGSKLQLEDGSRIAVVGGGPAGSFTSYFILDLAQRVGLDVKLDIYESRDYSVAGPTGCNMCGGIISESLVQMLAAEGINLPPTVVQRGIDSYVVHSDVGSVFIQTPLNEMRIAAVHRGSGPRGPKTVKWDSFDGYLLELARQKGANIIKGRVQDIKWDAGKPGVQVKGVPSQSYDFLVGAVGVNSPTIRLFEGMGFQYKVPDTTKTYIAEFYLGVDLVKKHFGSSMHVFLLNAPQIEFAALIPKGEYVTMCLLGHEIDHELVDYFLNLPMVRGCFPSDLPKLESACHCSPLINVKEAVHPYGDRVVLIGDCGVTRLYKDGIGAAYRSAKAVAVNAIFDGISEKDLGSFFWSACKHLSNDNRYGKMVFLVVSIIRKLRFMRMAVLQMARNEQRKTGKYKEMSMVLWDTFTGSAPYRSIFWRAMHPAFLLRLIWETVIALVPLKESKPEQETPCT